MWLFLLLCSVVAAFQIRASSVESEFSALEKQYQKAESDTMQAYSAAKTDADRAKIKWPGDEYGKKFLALAEQHPDDPGDVKPLGWVITRTQNADLQERALKLLSDHHAKTKGVGDIRMTYVYKTDVEPLLRKIIAENPNREDVGKSKLMLAQVLKNRIETAEYLKTASAEDLARFEKFVGKEKAEKMKHTDAAKLTAEADKLFQEVADKYSNVDSIGDKAKGELFEMHHLAIGKVAPDIEGTDVDGKKFKLSDYRGKVVMIDFFGDW